MTTTVTTLDDGLRGTGQDELGRAAPLMTMGTIFYVHHTGDDANDGLTRENPKATTQAAAALMSDGDMLVWLEGHTETISTQITFTGLERVTLVGLGEDDNGDQSVVFTPTGNPLGVSFDLGGGSFNELRNVKFAQASSPKLTFVLQSTGSYCRVCRVVFEGGQYNAAGLYRPGSWERVENCTFRAVGVSVANRPRAAIDLSSISLTVRNVTIDGGDYGWSSSPLYDAGGPGGGAVGAAFDGVALINSDVAFTSRIEGWVQFRSIDENSSFSWDQGAAATGALRHLPSGVGATGDTGLVAPNGPFYSNKPVIWCHYGTGSDSSSGVTRALAKKTLAAALVAAGSGGTVLLASGHAEPTSALVEIGNDYVTVIGIGRTNGTPSCKLVRTSGTNGTFSMAGDTGRVYNINFPSTMSLAVPSTTVDFVVALSDTNNQIRGCSIGVNAAVTGGGLKVGNVNAIAPAASDITVTSQGTSLSSRPTDGVKVVGASYTEDVLLENITVDSGAYGFAGLAINAKDSAYGILRAYNINLLRGSAFYIDAEFECSTVTLGTVNGGGAILWDTVA